MNKVLSGIIAFVIALPVWAVPTGTELIVGMEQLMWSSTAQGQLSMVVKTSYWQRTLELEVWLDRPEKTFIRIHAPKKEQGVGSLRLGDEMWNYLPKIDRTIKIPPSMMLQPWMGSDFSNDDLVKESSLEQDYTHSVVEQFEQDGNTIYRISSIPKPDAPVVWGKLEFLIREDFIPVRETFFDDRLKVIKVLEYSDIRQVDGRDIPTRWRMSPEEKPDQFTEVIIRDLIFDRPLDETIFSLRHLRNPR